MSEVTGCRSWRQGGGLTGLGNPSTQVLEYDVWHPWLGDRRVGGPGHREPRDPRGADVCDPGYWGVKSEAMAGLSTVIGFGSLPFGLLLGF